jgi:hypothetical protein
MKGSCLRIIPLFADNVFSSGRVLPVLDKGKVEIYANSLFITGRADISSFRGQLHFEVVLTVSLQPFGMW